MVAPDVEIQDGKGKMVAIPWFHTNSLCQGQSSYLVKKERQKVTTTWVGICRFCCIISYSENAPKSLATFGIGNGTRLQADDFCQNYQIVLILHTT